MNRKMGIKIFATICVLSSFIIINNESFVCASDVNVSTNTYAMQSDSSEAIFESTTCSIEQSTITPASNSSATSTPEGCTKTPNDTQGESSEGNSGQSDPNDNPKGDVEYVFYKKGDSVQDVADKIREYINKYHATSINGHPVSQSNIEDVARQIMEEHDNGTNSYDNNKIFIFILACAVSMFFGGKQRLCKK